MTNPTPELALLRTRLIHARARLAYWMRRAGASEKEIAAVGAADEADAMSGIPDGNSLYYYNLWKKASAEITALRARLAARQPAGDVEAVAEALWQADSVRATGRLRLETWTDVSVETQDSYRFNARAAIEAAEAAAWQPIESAPRDGTVDLLVTGGGSPHRVTDCKWYSGYGWCYPAEGWKYMSIKGRILAWRLPPPSPDPGLTQLHDGLRGETEAAVGDAGAEGSEGG